MIGLLLGNIWIRNRDWSILLTLIMSLAKFSIDIVQVCGEVNVLEGNVC